jgi:hypothetical protein
VGNPTDSACRSRTARRVVAIGMKSILRASRWHDSGYAHASDATRLAALSCVPMTPSVNVRLHSKCDSNSRTFARSALPD